MNRYAMLLLVTLVALGCQKAEDRFPKETRTVFGVPVTVTFFLPDAKQDEVKSGFDAAFSTLAWYEDAALKHGEKNQLDLIAAGAGKESVPTDTLVYAMLMRGLQLNDITAEAFDLRYGPLLDAWTKSGSPAKPAQADLDSALSLIKTGGMFVAGKSILLSKPNMRFDARGFVDAWAIDRAVEKLNAKGFTAFEIRTPYLARVVGMPVGEQSWTVKLSDPQNADSVFANLAMSQGGLAYLPAKTGKDGLGNFRLTLDPRTGEQATSNSIAMAKDCATAFALAYTLAIEKEPAKLSEQARTELMGSIRIQGNRPSYDVVSEGALKDKLRTLN